MKYHVLKLICAVRGRQDWCHTQNFVRGIFTCSDRVPGDQPTGWSLALQTWLIISCFPTTPGTPCAHPHICYYICFSLAWSHLFPSDISWSQQNPPALSSQIGGCGWHSIRCPCGHCTTLPCAGTVLWLQLICQGPQGEDQLPYLCAVSDVFCTAPQEFIHGS